MIPIELRDGVRLLKAQGQSLREISRLLKLSRNAVRRILREKDEEPAQASPPCDAVTLARIEEAFKRARGNGVRVHELLARENGLQVPYSTLTRWIREAELRDPPKRSGEYHQAPGEEMQQRHLAAPGGVVGQGGHGAVCRPDAGLLAPIVHPVLSALHPLRSEAVPARGGALP
jgi:transposase